MKLTADGVKSISSGIDRRMSMLEKTILSVSQSAILSGPEFSCKPLFVGNRIVIERLRCNALLKNGRYLDIDERVEIDFPNLTPGDYYMVAEIGDEEIVFDSNSLTYVRPRYKYSLMNLKETEESFGCPIAKFVVEQKNVFIDSNFIAPYRVCGDDEKLLDMIEKVAEKATEIANHAHLKPGIDREVMARYAYLLKNINRYDEIIKVYAILKDYLLAKHYHVFQSNGKEGQVIDNSLFFVDISEFLETILVAQDAAIILLDGVIPSEDKLDVEKLKREIKEELTAQLVPEIKDSLYETLREQISKELTEELSEKFNNQIESAIAEAREKLREELKDALHTVLHDELSNELNETLYAKLYEELYQKLYNALYDALFVPEPVIVDTFMPDI